MNISEILDTLPTSHYMITDKIAQNQYGQLFETFDAETTELENFDIAILGVPEDRENRNDNNCKNGPDIIRRELFKLHNWEPNFFGVDMGNIIPGETALVTCERLSFVVATLLRRGVLPIIIGGTHDMTIGQFLAYGFKNQSINLAVFDEKIDLMQQSVIPDSTSFLFNILGHEPNYLHHYVQAGYQHFLNDPELINILENMQFDCWRLAHLQENPNRMEPLVRNADMVSIDLSVLKYSDACGQKNDSPHGLNSENACKLARFAGLSDRVSSFGLYEFYGSKDRYSQSAQVVAQMIWHFIEGYYARKNEFPSQTKEDYFHYTVKMEDNGHDIFFVKSKKSERWWMKIPVTRARQKDRYEFVPCLYEDYALALKNEIPDVWMNALLRLS